MKRLDHLKGLLSDRMQGNGPKPNSGHSHSIVPGGLDVTS